MFCLIHLFTHRWLQQCLVTKEPITRSTWPQMFIQIFKFRGKEVYLTIIIIDNFIKIFVIIMLIKIIVVNEKKNHN